MCLGPQASWKWSAPPPQVPSRIYDYRVQIPGTAHPHPYPVYTGTYRPPKSCTLLFLDPGGDLHAAYAWPLGLMSDGESMPGEFRCPEPFSLELSSHRKTIYCRSLKQPGVRCWLAQRLYEAFSARIPTSALWTHDRTQTNESRSESQFARALCMASHTRCSRSRGAHEWDFAHEPTHDSLET